MILLLLEQADQVLSKDGSKSNIGDFSMRLPDSAIKRLEGNLVCLGLFVCRAFGPRKLLAVTCIVSR
jgi:hypothetical protein